MSSRQRAKYSERENARKFIEVDGRDEGTLGSSATSTGRVGFLTHLQCDFVSKHYVGEVKYVSSKAKDPSFRLTRSIVQKIQEVSKKFGKKAVIVVHFAGLEPIHCILESRHFELLSKDANKDSQQKEREGESGNQT